MSVYGNETYLAAYLGTAAPADAARLLEHASDLIDDVTRGNAGLAYDGMFSGVLRAIPTEISPYTQAEYRSSLAKAVYAQVEFWIEVGTEHDIVGLTGSLTAGKLNISNLPARLAPRARRALDKVNLCTAQVTIG